MMAHPIFSSPPCSPNAPVNRGVSEADLSDIVRRGPACGSDARDAFRPGIQVAPGVPGGDGLAGGAAGCVDAHHLAHGHGQQLEGVLLPQLGFGCQGDFGNVLQCANIRWLYARLDHLVMIHGHMVVGMLYAPFQALQLDCFDFASLCAFDLRVPDRHGKTLLPYCLFPRRRPFLLGYLATLAERRAVVL